MQPLQSVKDIKLKKFDVTFERRSVEMVIWKGENIPDFPPKKPNPLELYFIIF